MSSIRLASAALALAAGTGLLQATSIASASTPTPSYTPTGPVAVRSWNDCPQGRMCIWRLPNAHGSRLSFVRGASDLTKLGGALNDHTMSFWNRTSKTWCMYADVKYKGDTFKVPHEPLAGARANTGRFGYKVSSLRPDRLFGGC